MKVVKGNYTHFRECLVCKIAWDLQLFLYLLKSYLRLPRTAELRVPFQKIHKQQHTVSTAARMQSLTKMTLCIQKIVLLDREQHFSAELAETVLIWRNKLRRIARIINNNLLPLYHTAKLVINCCWNLCSFFLPSSYKIILLPQVQHCHLLDISGRNPDRKPTVQE